MRRMTVYGKERTFDYLPGRTHFVPAFDDTDHFHWACEECEAIADVMHVERNDSYAGEPPLYFRLRCPQCGRTGQRKIYSADRDPHFMQIPAETRVLKKP